MQQQVRPSVDRRLASFGPNTTWQQIAAHRRRDLTQLIDTRIAPLVAEAERTQTFPPEICRALGEEGFLSIGSPVEQGGEGGGRTSEVMVVEELAKISSGVTMSVVPHFIVRIAVFEFGSKRVIEEVGRPMIRGQRIVGICMSEPDAGSDVAALKTRAVPDGSGWRITGSKMFITNGSIADDLLVAARTGDGSGDISLFLMETAQPGYTAHKLDKEAARASDTTLLNLDGCYVPPHRVIGTIEGGFRQAMRVLNGERVLSAARAIQLAQSSWEDAVAWATDHSHNGVQALGLQMFQGPLAAAAAELWALQVSLAHVCRLWDEGAKVIPEVSMLKTISTLTSVRITRDMQELVGDVGHAPSTRISRNAIDARLGTVTAGTEQIMHRILSRQFGWPAASC
jgi:alkylation response protein AidB-like acyl-CoA dehydrogenase